MEEMKKKVAMLEESWEAAGLEVKVMEEGWAAAAEVAMVVEVEVAQMEVQARATHSCKTMWSQ